MGRGITLFEISYTMAKKFTDWFLNKLGMKNRLNYFSSKQWALNIIIPFYTPYWDNFNTPSWDDFTHLDGIISTPLSGTKCTQIGKNSNFKNLCLNLLKEVDLPLLKWDFGELALRTKRLILELLALYEKWSWADCLLSYPSFLRFFKRFNGFSPPFWKSPTKKSH